MARNPVCVALDVSDSSEALSLAERLVGHVGMVKIGLELFCSAGPAIVRDVQRSGLDVFLDLKLCDIPNTVGKAAASIAALGAAMVNVHALGGHAMMRAARDGVRRGAEPCTSPPKVLAVTVLTSIDKAVLNEELRISGHVAEEVAHLATAAKNAGLDGVVCSAQEVAIVRESCGEDFLIVTPGIRPAWAVSDDQKRVTTPREAIDLGADVIVIGRPILRADNPAEAADRVLEEISR